MFCRAVARTAADRLQSAALAPEQTAQAIQQWRPPRRGHHEVRPHGQAVRFFGTAAPAHDGKPVLIQKRTTSGYKTVAHTVLRDNGTATSKYSKKLTIRSNATYRVVVQSLDQAIDNGTSRTRSLRVH